MKILITGDTHIGNMTHGKFSPEYGLNAKIVNQLEVFNEMVDYAVNNKIDLFIHLGDIYEYINPIKRQEKLLVPAFIKLSKNGISVLIIDGTHDRTHDAFAADNMSTLISIAKESELPMLQRIVVHDEPNIFYFTKDDLNIKFLCLPEPNDHQLDGQLIGEYISGHTKNLLKDKTKSNYTFALGHFAVDAANHKNMRSDVLVPAKLFKTTKIDHTFLGHLHTYQKVNKKITYPGSTTFRSMDEAGDTKGFLELEITQENMSFKFIEIPSVLKMYQIFADIKEQEDQDIMPFLLERISAKNYKHSIVQLCIKLKESQAAFIDIKQITEQLPCHNLIIKRDVEHEGRTRDADINRTNMPEEEQLERFFDLYPTKYSEFKTELMTMAKEVITERNKRNQISVKKGD